MIKIEKFVFNPFQVNSFVLYTESGECFIADPSCQGDAEIKILEDFINENELIPTGVINTHGHVDHLPGVKYFKEKYQVPFYLSQEDEFLVNGAVEYGAVFGFYLEQPPLPDKHLKEGEVLILGDDEISLIHVPGHSPGSIVFYLKNESTLITGDVLFALSIGRTDLPGGNYGQLITGIKEKLLVLDDETLVYPGHGPATTIGQERKMNPFLQ